MNNDLTFFTNKPNATLFDRFRKTLKDSRFSDILVGCHSANGFHKLPDPFLADAIELLTVDHEGLHAPEAPAFIDYSSLRSVISAIYMKAYWNFISRLQRKTWLKSGKTRSLYGRKHQQLKRGSGFTAKGQKARFT